MGWNHGWNPYLKASTPGKFTILKPQVMKLCLLQMRNFRSSFHLMVRRCLFLLGVGFQPIFQVKQPFIFGKNYQRHVTATDIRLPRTWAKSPRSLRFRELQHLHPRLPWLQASPFRDEVEEGGGKTLKFHEEMVVSNHVKKMWPSFIWNI